MTGILVIVIGIFIGYVYGVLKHIKGEIIIHGEIYSRWNGYDGIQNRQKYMCYVQYVNNGEVCYLETGELPKAYPIGKVVRLGYNPSNGRIRVMPTMTKYILTSAIICAGMIVAVMQFSGKI